MASNIDLLAEFESEEEEEEQIQDNILGESVYLNYSTWTSIIVKCH